MKSRSSLKRSKRNRINEERNSEMEQKNDNRRSVQNCFKKNIYGRFMRC